MKCEICGNPTEQKMCDWLTNVMCPEHAKQVKDYIEGLKPRLRPIVHESAGYWVSCDGRGAWITNETADALYEYMRRERADA